MARRDTLELLGNAGRFELDEAQRELSDASGALLRAGEALSAAHARRRALEVSLHEQDRMESQRLGEGAATAGDLRLARDWRGAVEEEIVRHRLEEERRGEVLARARARADQARERIEVGVRRRDALQERAALERRRRDERRDALELEERPLLRGRRPGLA